jgi:hypothetical protein
MKRLIAAFALTTLAASTIALAQTAQTPDTSAPPSDTQSQMQSQQPSQPSDQGTSSSGSDQSTTQSGTADKETLMKTCISQVQASNPNVSQKDIKDFCDREVNKPSSSPQ